MDETQNPMPVNPDGEEVVETPAEETPAEGNPAA